LGLFRDDVSNWLSVSDIESAVAEGVDNRPPQKGIDYYSFVDASGGGGQDSCTCGIAHREGERIVLDNLLEIRPKFDPIKATEQIAELLKAYNLTITTGDAYAGDWVLTTFAKFGITYRKGQRASRL
jgi:hypothetical protein